MNLFKISKNKILDIKDFIKQGEFQVIEDNIDHFFDKKFLKGNFWIKGDILSGTELQIDGNLQVEGVVEKVKIKCNGDVIIKNGFLGQNEGYVECNGNFYATYIQNSSVKANEIIIGDSVSNSNIIALHGLIVHGKGKIISGNFYAKDYIIAKEIGSSSLTKTNLKIGYDFLRKRKIEKIKEKLVELKLNIDENEELFRNIFKKIDYPEYEIDIIIKNITNFDESNIKLLKLLENIQLKEEFEFLKEELERINTRDIANLDAFLKTNIIHPGVNISILDKSIFINKKLEKDDIIMIRENVNDWKLLLEDLR